MNQDISRGFRDQAEPARGLDRKLEATDGYPRWGLKLTPLSLFQQLCWRLSTLSLFTSLPFSCTASLNWRGAMGNGLEQSIKIGRCSLQSCMSLSPIVTIQGKIDSVIKSFNWNSPVIELFVSRKPSTLVEDDLDMWNTSESISTYTYTNITVPVCHVTCPSTCQVQLDVSELIQVSHLECEDSRLCWADNGPDSHWEGHFNRIGEDYQ